MVQKEIEVILALEVYQGLKVSPAREETLEFQVFQDRVLMEPGGRTGSQVFLVPRASLARFWVPHLEGRDQMVYLDSRETRVTLVHQENQDCLAVMDVLVLLD